MSFNFSMEDVLPLIGIAYPYNRVSFDIPCPVCDVGKRTKHLNINLRKNTFRCPRCGDVQGGVLDLYALFVDCSRGAAYKAISQSLGVAAQNKPQKIQPVIKESEPAPVSRRDAVYRALLSMLPLTQDHIRNLRNRGLDDEQISVYGFRSAIPDEMINLGSVLQKQGYSMNGVPGFYKFSDEWRIRCDYSGILIPVLDTEGRIQGLQLRLDDKDKRKYRWISSSGLEMGTPAQTYPHFIGKQSETILITEGPMKGDIINALSGMSVLAVPGVNCLSLLDPMLRILKSKGTRRIKTAFDMDFLSNPHVQTGYNQLCSLLDEIGFYYSTYTWNPGFNGLDDYLKSIGEK